MTVKDAEGVLVGDADVEIKYTGNGTVVASGKTAPFFGVWMTNLGAGDYTVTVSKSGYTTATETFQLTGNEYSHSITITLEGGDLLWLWILLLIVVIAVILILLMFILKRRKKASEEPVPLAGIQPGASPVEGDSQQQESQPAAGQKICKNCGSPLEPEYVICPNCGKET